MNSSSLATKSSHLEKNSSHTREPSNSRNFDGNITVRFELNEFDTVAQVYSELTTIGDVLDDVASKFQLLPKYLTIKRKSGGSFPKSAHLIQLCTNSFRIFDVKLGLSDLANHINESIHIEHEKIRLDTDLYYRYSNYCNKSPRIQFMQNFFNFHSQNLLPDFISVAIPDKDDAENSKCIIVEIINIPIVKPFIGGYVNKLTGENYMRKHLR